ncbi:hypothetical protein RM533_08275 [Croceicoccus sp. F390]|uniref:C-type lysozyme inhibitor domain-containing protein n=1 Tax=Croceicoccus esteveae TaxID=3075597 RepID=A0ABU2ZIF8_9SPHN|nr:hypothetical protein [Croceicoccus sp. F390]MDT0576180.1 hypothetical protein [Croceicoccus sp. F390]
MNQLICRTVPVLLLALCACSGGDSTPAQQPIRIRLDSIPLSAPLTQEGRAPPVLLNLDAYPANIALPGEIDPPAARWIITGNQSGSSETQKAVYGAPGEDPLLMMQCKDGTIAVERPVAAAPGARAVLSFVGYRGILRLRVENDGERWQGALPADDRRWIAVTGGPFYATVAGGGKLVTPGPGTAEPMLSACAKAVRDARRSRTRADQTVS